MTATSSPLHHRWAREVRDVVAAVPLFVSAPLLRPWHTRWGATDAEVATAMPGDDLVPGCQYRTTRAITIAAAAEAVWPWLVQVGFNRAGFYSLDLLDNLGRPSAEELLPQFQNLQVGQWVPMSPTPSGRTAFRVHSYEEPRYLLWAKADSTWCWTLTDLSGGRTRLVTRIRTRYDWRHPVDAALGVLLMEVGDFPMLRRMLHGIRDRAEPAPEASSGSHLLLSEVAAPSEASSRPRCSRRRTTRPWRLRIAENTVDGSLTRGPFFSAEDVSPAATKRHRGVSGRRLHPGGGAHTPSVCSGEGRVQ